MSLPHSIDDVPWEALAALLAGELSGEERGLVDRWLAEDPSHEAVLAVLRQGWEASAATRRRYDAEAALRWIKGHSEERAAAEPRRPLVRPAATAPRFSTAVRRALLAASVAALAFGGWRVASREARQSTGADSGHAALAEYRTARGQRLALRLPDGSSVMLGPASTLRVAPASTWKRVTPEGARARTVELEGEAYFEVKHDATRPFSVRTTHTLVRDLGTRFVIRAHREDGITDVVVTEGLVAVGRLRPSEAADSLPADSLVLEPGQRARLTETGTLAFTPRVPLDEYLDWTTGRLVFRDTPLPEALRRLGRWYDVRVRLGDAELAGRTITASFRDEPASDAIRQVASLFGLRVDEDDEGFLLRSAAR